jgi:hypothetical protein
VRGRRARPARAWYVVVVRGSESGSGEPMAHGHDGGRAPRDCVRARSKRNAIAMHYLTTCSMGYGAPSAPRSGFASPSTPAGCLLQLITNTCPVAWMRGGREARRNPPVLCATSKRRCPPPPPDPRLLCLQTPSDPAGRAHRLVIERVGSIRGSRHRLPVGSRQCRQCIGNATTGLHLRRWPR